MPNPVLLYFRRYNGAEPLTLTPPGLPSATIQPGQWVRADMLAGSGRDGRAFGPPVKASRLPDDVRPAALAQQPIIQPGAPADDPTGSAARADADADEIARMTAGVLVVGGDPELVVRCRRYIEATGVEVGWEAGTPDPDAVVLVDQHALVAAGWLEGLKRAAVATGAHRVAAMSNIGPQALPLAGDTRPLVTPRMPAGSFRAVAAALEHCPPLYPKRSLGMAPVELHFLDGRKGPAVMADNVYVWSSQVEDDDAAVKCPPPPVWAARAARYVRHVQGHRQGGIPVHLMAVDLGHWGGAYCTLRLAQELDDRGFRVTVGRLRPIENREPWPLGTVLHQHERTLGPRFSEEVGWREGICIATHWSTGRLVRWICKDNPGVIPVAFWQDLEHRFVNPATGQRRFPVDQALEYVTIPHRVYNAPWVWDEGAAEFGLTDDDWTAWIPVGVDMERFRPREGARAAGPVRVLAMWRPQTPRRGADVLREVYQRLKGIHGAHVELHLYGWTDDGDPPACAVRHGVLTQRQVADLVREMDIFIEPSSFQGFGLPGAEAMASGVALVSTDCKGVHAYADRDSAIILEPDADPVHGLTQAVSRLAGLPEERERLAAAGHAKVQAISWERVGNQWADYLRRLWEAKRC